MPKKIKARRGAKKARSRIGVDILRRGRNNEKMHVDLFAVDGEHNQMRFRFDYRFENTELLDEIEAAFRTGIAEMDLNRDGVLSSEEVVGGLALFFLKMSEGITEIAAQVEDD